MKRTAVASWLVRLGLAVALVAIAWATALPAVPPGPVPASAPQDTSRQSERWKSLRLWPGHRIRPGLPRRREYGVHPGAGQSARVARPGTATSW
jgi:hypothetical protein